MLLLCVCAEVWMGLQPLKPRSLPALPRPLLTSIPPCTTEPLPVPPRPLQAMGQGYLAMRPHYIETTFQLAASMGLKEVTVYDAVLLMDRVMSTGIQLAHSFGPLFAAAVRSSRACTFPCPALPSPKLSHTAFNHSCCPCPPLLVPTQVAPCWWLQCVASTLCKHLNLYWGLHLGAWALHVCFTY